MEKSIEKIKQELEQKRKHNTELLQFLKQKSIIYGAEKEKQKKNFLNKTSTFLNKKRKQSNHIINIDNNSQNQINNSSYDMMNSFEDYDDYYEDFMNNSMISNKIFTNLNFCRPERFFLDKKPKIKLSITKKEQELTIEKVNKNKNLTIQNSINFQSSVQKKDNVINNNFNTGTGLGVFSGNKNDIDNKKDEEISFFDGNIDKKEKEIDTKFINNEINNKGSLFGQNINFNEKSIFSSNIPKNNNNEEKQEMKELKDKDNNKEKTEDKKEPIKLFGNLDRLNKSENKNNTLFGTPTKPNIEKEKGKESTPKTPKKEEKKEKEIVNNRNLFGAISTPKIETKIEEKKENKKEDNKEVLKLFEETPTPNPFFDIKEKKETIKLPPLEPKKEENEQNKEKKENKPLFGNLLFKQDNNNNDKDKNKVNEKENPNSMFSGTGLFGNSKENNTSLFNNDNDNKDNKGSLFGNLTQGNNNKEIKEEKKETINLSIFNNSNNNPSLFGNNIKEENKVKTNEEPKSIITSNATGSLATNDNPFLNPTPSKELPPVFNTKFLLNNANGTNTKNNLFNVGNNNSNLFNNNGPNTSLFNNQGGMGFGGMDTSPNLAPRNLFNNNNMPNNNNSLFNNSNNPNKVNIFGAISNNNTNSLFNNNNTFQPNNGGLFGQSGFSSGMGTFSMGK